MKTQKNEITEYCDDDNVSRRRHSHAHPKDIHTYNFSKCKFDLFKRLCDDVCAFVLCISRHFVQFHLVYE